MIFIWFFYDVVVSIVIVGYPLVYFLRNKFSLEAYREKLSWYNARVPVYKRSIWIHAVSVGEVLLLRKFLPKIRAEAQLPIVLSTTTPTGYKVAAEHFSSCAAVVYFPFDHSLILKRFLKRFNPLLCILLETELWPNVCNILQRRGIANIVLNGRISDAAYRRYCKIRAITKLMLEKVLFIGAQTEEYRQRFIHLGADEDKVSVTGNMKFDCLQVQPQRIEYIRQRYPCFTQSSFPLLLGASTHDPEEKWLIGIYSQILSRYPLRMILAPRHPQRVVEVARMVKDQGFTPKLLSKGISERDYKEARNIYVLDTVGEMFYLCGLCNVCFVGGSLIPHGGHNILEPMFFSKPTLFGPWMDNFKAVEEIVLSAGAAIRVDSPQALKKTLISMLRDPSLIDRLAKNCEKVFARERHYLEINVRKALEFIPSAQKKKTK